MRTSPSSAPLALQNGSLLAIWARARELPLSNSKCGTVPLFITDEEDSFGGLLMLLLLWTVTWCAIWLFCALLAKGFVHLLPPSSKERENSAFYVGQKIAMTLKALVVAGMCNVGLYDNWGQPLAVKLAGNPIPEVAGVLFTSAEAADLLMSGAWGFLDPEHIAHHLVHILLGLLIRSSCVPGFTACILMAQETSSVFLNYYLLMRHRSRAHITTLAAQALFALCFYAWRLGIGTYGTYQYLVHAHASVIVAAPPMPLWKSYTLCASLVAATLLQWYWGVTIARGLVRMLSGSKPAAKQA